jgi:hypothetical protein
MPQRWIGLLRRKPIEKALAPVLAAGQIQQGGKIDLVGAFGLPCTFRDFDLPFFRFQMAFNVASYLPGAAFWLGVTVITNVSNSFKSPKSAARSASRLAIM